MNWPNRPLGDVITIDRVSVQPEEIRSGTLYVGLENIMSDGVFDAVQTVENGDLASSKFSFNEQHVLFGKLRPYLKKVIRPTFSGVCSTDILPLKVGTKVDRDYLYHWLRLPHVVELATSLSSGVNLPRISPNTLLEFKFPIPPLAEQKRIAAILDEADALRRKRREAITKLDTLLQSAFVSMFGNFDMFPKAQLRDVCGFITKGTTPKPSELHPRQFENAVAFLKVYNIGDDGRIAFDVKQTFISSSYHRKELARSKVLPGDVLMNIVGPPLGKIGIVPDTYPEWNINQAVAIFRPEEKLRSWYLLYALRSPLILPGILEQAAGIRQLNLSLEQCRSITIPLPHLPLQQEFEKRAIEINLMCKQQRTSLKHLEALFVSLQHQAFSAPPNSITVEKTPIQPCLTLDF
jgi:type I restriction enzyme S subunit